MRCGDEVQLSQWPAPDLKVTGRAYMLLGIENQNESLFRH